MLPFLGINKSSFNQRKTLLHANNFIQKEKGPKFEHTSIIPLNSSRNRAFYSNVIFDGGLFENMTAFHASPVLGTGGVVFASTSTVSIYGSSFKNNQAICGGSLSLDTCDFMCNNKGLEDTVFSENLA